MCMTDLAMMCGSADSDLVLDPHISYEGMKLDYASDVSLSAYLKSSKIDLYQYYEAHYAEKHSAPSQVTNPVLGPLADSSVPPHSLKKDLHCTFRGRPRPPLMNSTNSSSLLKRTSRLAIQSIGRWAAMLNSPTCFGLLETSSVCLVAYCVLL